MKFQTQQTDLIQELNCLVRNTDSKIPAYSNILIKKSNKPIIKICARCQKITCFYNCNFGWYRWQAVYDNTFELIRDQILRLLNLR